MKTVLSPTTKITCILAVAATAQPTFAQQSVQDFQLPPGPEETGTPAQGPVDPDAPFVSAPRPVNTPTPTPTPQPTPIATQTPVPAASPTSPAAVATATPQSQPTLGPASTPTPVASPTASAQPLPGEPEQSLPGLPVPATQSAVNSLPPSPGAATEAQGVVFPYWIWAALAGVVVLALLAFTLMRRRKYAEAPEIERPIVPGVAPSPIPADKPMLTLKAEAVSLSRSMMNATLNYRLTLTNRSTAALSGVVISGDLVSAHGGKPVGDQVADQRTSLAPRHEIGRVSPGKTVNLSGTLQLPLSQVSPIRQGNSPLLVPLMRWRASSEASEPATRTYVVGLRPQVVGGKLQPFRLDEQPQTYSQIGERPID